MKRFFASIAFVAIAVSSFAGGLLTNTNQSASFVRNPMRYASLETDAIYFNPAGTAFFKEGWAFSVNWQMIWQDRDILHTKHLVEPGEKKHKGEVFVPCMPTLFAAYKKGNWTFSGYFGIPGGGGKAEFNDGLPLFNTLGNGFKDLLPIMTGSVADGNAYSEFQSTQYVFSLQLGAAYRINNNLSAYAGLRTNYTSASYEGNIAMNGIHPVSGRIKNTLLALNLKQTGIAFAPVIGVNYKIGKVHLAAKYEFRAVTNIKNDTDNLEIFNQNYNKGVAAAGNTIGTKTYAFAYKAAYEGAVAAGMPENVADQFAKGKANEALQGVSAAGDKLGTLSSLEDGKKLRSDAPALLSVAASWEICPRLQVMGGVNYYFDKDAKVESLLGATNNNAKLSRNTYEILGGVEFKLTKKWLLSAGFQFSDYGVNDEYLSDVSFINDSFMTGLGAKYSLNDKLDLNFGVCYANYAKSRIPDYDNHVETKYLRKTYNVSVGVDFRF